MPATGLNKFIEFLEEKSELIRIGEFVDPELEICEITDRISKQKGGGKALLFENTGTRFPVLINALGSEKRISLAFHRNSLDELEKELNSSLGHFITQRPNFWDKLRLLSRLKKFSGWMPVRLAHRGKCQDIIIPEPDLAIFPILKCWPADGGRFITLPAVHTVDPETNSPNVGMYRMQVFGKNLTGMHWHRHKTGANHFLKYKRAGKRMPVSVALGGDPVYTYAATAPVPENMDEYLLAGFLRKKAVKLVKCITNDLYVPEDSDIIVEGYIDPSEDFILEGPFGDHTGFYSLADYYPKFHVTCITHGKNAVFPATIVGIPPMEDAYIGKATERIFLSPIRLSLIPEIEDMDMPFPGVAHNLAIIKIKKSYPGQAQKVMHSLWGAGQMMFNKILIVVDEGFDIHNYSELIRNSFFRFHPEYIMHFTKGPLDILDHSSSFFAFGSKVGIDLTDPLEGEISDNSFPVGGEETIIPVNLPWVEELKNLFPLLQIPVLLLSVNKKDDYSREILLGQLQSIIPSCNAKLIVLVDFGIDLSDYFSIIWITGANVDPLRDIRIVTNGKQSVAVIDATMKNHSSDRFTRHWPNVVISDQETIQKVDEKWNRYGLGESVKSPSLRFSGLVRNRGAISLPERSSDIDK